jgi:hypothetical protein
MASRGRSRGGSCGSTSTGAVTLLDSDGSEIVAGCHLHFGYGIPPVPVDAEIVERGGKLVALTPGHNPASATVSTIVRDFDCWVDVPRLK